MTQLKQKTVEGRTVTLHKLENPMSQGGRYLYEVRIDGQTDEEAFTKQDAESAFSLVVKDLKRGVEIGRSQPHSEGGMFGGGFSF